MRGAWSVARIRAAETALIERVGADTLMERAAYGLSVGSAGLLDRTYGARVVLLVGAGNNGGDALYAGVHLLRRGAAVHAVLLAPDRVHVRAAIAFAAAGGGVGTAETAAAPLAGADLVLDGIVGIGGSGALRPPADDLVAAVGCPILAVDLPSGVDADTGDVPGAAVRAAATVTFGGAKLGLVVGPGVAHRGALSEVDIGLGPFLGAPQVQLLDDSDVAALLPRPEPASDKYGSGVVGVVAGSPTYGGAAVLSVGGALHGKAGMVRYAGRAADAVRARWPEAVVTDGSPTRAGRVQAWVVGPGLGTDEPARRQLREVLETDVAVLVDADGLTLLGEHPEWVRGRRAPTLLTPHDREFERVAGPLGTDRVAAVRRAAAELGVTVLLKGQATIVAGPDGRVLVNPTGSGWLATAGTGDVLSGLGGALLAAGLDPLRAAAAAAYLHGLAGSRAAGAADRIGTGSGAPITAMQVVAAIPGAIRALGSGG